MPFDVTSYASKALHTAVHRMTSSDEQTASGIHRLRPRLRRAAIVFARSRTTRWVRLTTDARATERESCAIDLSKEFLKPSLMRPPLLRDATHEAAPFGASAPPIRDKASI